MLLYITMKEVLIIIPVYNEEKSVAEVINEIKRDIDFADILIVNDCSTDNTLEIVKNYNIHYLSLPFNLGYSGALQCGFKYAVNNNYKYIIQYDGDGQHIAAEAKRLYNFIKKEKVDIVIGSRFLNNGTYKHPFLKKIGTNIFKIVIKIFTKIKITDPTSGFQILNFKAFKEYANMHNFPEYPDANLILEMIYKDYHLKEIGIKMRERKYGMSMHQGIIKPARYIMKFIYAVSIILVHYIIFKKEK